VPSPLTFVPVAPTSVHLLLTSVPVAPTFVPVVLTFVPVAPTFVPPLLTFVPSVPTFVPPLLTTVSELPTSVPELRTGVPELRTGVPELPTSVPGLRTSVRNLPTSLPPRPTAVRALPNSCSALLPARPWLSVNDLCRTAASGGIHPDKTPQEENMANIDYERFVRILSRCMELAADSKQPQIIGLVYKETTEAPVAAFLAADKAVTTATGAFAKEQHEALKALDDMDTPYRVARSAVLAVLPDTVLPDTLKKRPTDTDKLNAIEGLLDVVDDHVGKGWADELLNGEFGQKAAQTVKELNEAIAANKDLGKVIAARATAYGPAYEAYLRFKRVVRDALGPSSKEYRRIHLRASPGAAANGEVPAGETPPENPVAPPAEDKVAPPPDNNVAPLPPV
jgi:hypothetical protein